jgi:APA family basic amino acid/polyamine antiporter
MKKLKRELGLFEATIYGVGIILGAGIYALIGEAAGLAGNSVWLSFLIGAFVASFTGLSYAELSTMFPKAAAEYVYIRKASGSRLIAFLLGWLILWSEVVAASTVSLGFSGYFVDFMQKLVSIPSETFAKIIVAICLICALSFLNFLGIKESAKFNIVFTFVEAIGLICIILLAVPFFGKVNYYQMPGGLKGVFSAAALIFFAYLGFEDIANIAEEVKNPKRNLPLAFIIAILVTALLYVLVSLSVVSLANWRELSLSDAPLALAASKVLGNNAYFFISFVALFATANTVLVISIVGSRMLYGMARDRTLPEILSLVHKERRTPWIAILIFTLLSILFVLPGEIILVANLTSLIIFVTFASVNLSLIWLRFKAPRAKRVFKVPLNIKNFPLLAFLGLLINLFMITRFKPNLLLFTLFVVALGLTFYIILKKKLPKFFKI